MASSSGDYTVKIWSIESQKEVITLHDYCDYVWSVAFSPDGRYLASGSEDRTVRLWGLESQKEVITLSGH